MKLKVLGTVFSVCRTADLSRYAMRFLRDGGMSDAEILTLTEKLKTAPANTAPAP